MKNEIIPIFFNKKIKNTFVDIMNYPGVLQFTCSQEMNYSRNISRKLTNELLSMFGKHTSSFRGEFYYKLWFFEYRNNIFEVNSSNRGTSISVSDNSKKEFYTNTELAKECIDFAREFNQLIKNYEN